MLEFTPLGGGREVGRSCLLVKVHNKRVLLDCGIHTGYQDHRVFPNFDLIATNRQDLQSCLDAVVITHFHLDHLGALPHLTEKIGYRGPIFMTAPTRAIGKTLLSDYRWVMVDRKHATDFYTEDDVNACFRRVSVIALGETILLDDELEISTYYAGHVLGAIMVRVAVKGASVVYSGDFNAAPNQVLGCASIPRLSPDLLICEATYANSDRSLDRQPERHFLNVVLDAVHRGAKVLVPVMAFGAAQEMQLMLEDLCQRKGLDCPVYFSAGLVAKANLFHRLFAAWMHRPGTLSEVSRKSAFNFDHVRPFERGALERPGPCVLFATPHMFAAGLALEAFRAWAGNEENVVLLPSVCLPTTIGFRLLAGKREIRLPGDPDDAPLFQVRSRIETISFSAHADRRGLEWLIGQVGPRNVALVHGYKEKMLSFRPKIVKRFGISAFAPDNGECIRLRAAMTCSVLVSPSVIKSAKLSQDIFNDVSGPSTDNDQKQDASYFSSNKRQRSDSTTDDIFDSAAKVLRTNARSAATGETTRCVSGILVVSPDSDKFCFEPRRQVAVVSSDTCTWGTPKAKKCAHPSSRAWLVSTSEAANLFGLKPHRLSCRTSVALPSLPISTENSDLEEFVRNLKLSLEREVNVKLRKQMNWESSLDAEAKQVCALNDGMRFQVMSIGQVMKGVLTWEWTYSHVAEEIVGALSRLRKKEGRQ